MFVLTSSRKDKFTDDFSFETICDVKEQRLWVVNALTAASF